MNKLGLYGCVEMDSYRSLVLASLIFIVNYSMYLTWKLNMAAYFPVYQTRHFHFDCGLFYLPKLEIMILTTTFNVWNGAHYGSVWIAEDASSFFQLYPTLHLLYTFKFLFAFLDYDCVLHIVCCVLLYSTQLLTTGNPL
jgi:hypothetical protein